MTSALPAQLPPELLAGMVELLAGLRAAGGYLDCTWDDTLPTDASKCGDLTPTTFFADPPAEDIRHRFCHRMQLDMSVFLRTPSGVPKGWSPNMFVPFSCKGMQSAWHVRGAQGGSPGLVSSVFPFFGGRGAGHK